MKTNLAYISAVLDRSIGETHTSDDFAGFKFKRQIDQMSREATSYAQAREEAKESLKRAGIEPIGFVPTAWWNKILAESGLVVSRGGSGDVGISRSLTNKAARAAGRFSLLFFGLFLVGSIVGFYQAALAMGYPSFHKTDMDAFMFGIIGLGVGVAGVFVMLNGGPLSLVHRAAAWTYVLLRGGERRLRKAFLKNFDESTHDSDAIRVRATLPTPPAEVATVLLKMREAKHLRSNMGVAAEPQAWHLEQSLANRIAMRLSDDVEARRAAMREAIRLDPIIFYQFGEVVAVVAQFGDFPIEKEVVDKVVEAGL
jgi:hypothetical protein